MTSPRCDFVRSKAPLGHAARRGLAQPVGAAMRQSSGIALVAKPIAKARRRERLAELCRQERHVGWCRSDDGGERRQQRYIQLNAGLLLLNMQELRGLAIDDGAPDVLPSH